MEFIMKYLILSAVILFSSHGWAADAPSFIEKVNMTGDGTAFIDTAPSKLCLLVRDVNEVTSCQKLYTRRMFICPTSWKIGNNLLTCSGSVFTLDSTLLSK
jgi:hypothetical protein